MIGEFSLFIIGVFVFIFICVVSIFMTIILGMFFVVVLKKIANKLKLYGIVSYIEEEYEKKALKSED